MLNVEDDCRTIACFRGCTAALENGCISENYSIPNLPNRTGYNQFILRTNRSSLRIGSMFSKSGYTERYDDEGREKILLKFMVGVRGMNLWREVRKQPRNAGKKVEFEAVSRRYK